ncbi:MAG: DUF1178 family protein [Rhodospirillaceae bacterium]|nr:DUF1178 family protein [Rhodospirillaceae bacterium]
MILYDLNCEREHRFESWFRNSKVVERLIKAGEVACPRCGSTKVQKAPMAPRIAKSDEASQAVSAEQQELEAAMDKANSALKELRDVIEKNFEHVGDKFPDEARRIHYGESKERAIYGNASKEDAKKLLDEGIEVYAIPGKRKTNA